MKKQLSIIFFVFGVFLFALGCSNDSYEKTKKTVEASEFINEKRATVKEDRKQPDLKTELNKIALPDKPSNSTIATYILQILALSQDMEIYSQNDPQVDFLTKVGEEYIDVLLDFGNIKALLGGFYINKAIGRIATENNKNKIIDNLRQNEDLAEVVLNNGWEVDARDVLIDMLYEEKNVPRQVVEAVVKLDDPSTYDALIYYFVHGTNQCITHNLIKNLSGINASDHIIEAWEAIEPERNNYEKMLMACLVVQFGRKDALETLIETLSSFNSRGINEKYLPILKTHVASEGDLEDIAAWYNTNKDQIIFDYASKKFILEE